MRVLLCLFAAALLAPAADAQVVRFEATLGGVFETPPVPTTAFGTAIVDVDMTTGAIAYDVQFTGFAATVAHIHTGAAGVAGPVLVPLSGGPTSFVGSATMPTASFAALVSEGLYVNVHSAAFPSGEIRGQLLAPRNFDAHLDGAQETPPVPTAATGAMRFVRAPAAGTVAYSGTYGGMTTTVAHVHDAPVGVPGGIVYPLSFGPTTLGGVSPVLALGEQIAMLRGLHYANLHSAAFPAGEIRGQLEPGPIWANGDAISVSRGGLVDFHLAAPPSVAGQVYALLGSASGTVPGIPFGGQVLPLNFDPYFDLTLTAPLPFLTNSIGLLDPASKANARLQLPPGLPPGLAGATLDHAYLVIDLFGSGAATFASSSWPIALLP